MFDPFIKDDVPFEEYCKTMDNDGTWAGHMELQAASLVTRNNICIHQVRLTVKLSTITYMKFCWLRSFHSFGRNIQTK